METLEYYDGLIFVVFRTIFYLYFRLSGNLVIIAEALYILLIY